jgi:hypothetical protein
LIAKFQAKKKGAVGTTPEPPLGGWRSLAASSLSALDAKT